jgi:hypothetical protein
LARLGVGRPGAHGPAVALALAQRAAFWESVDYANRDTFDHEHIERA